MGSFPLFGTGFNAFSYDHLSSGSEKPQYLRPDNYNPEFVFSRYMKKEDFTINRSLKSVKISSDLVVVGGGLSGVCTAITAARAGIQVVLVQDRPVLGGNCSSEVRLWILGATSHMGNNNRWAREGGVIDEILVENMYRNREGNPIILDTIILDKVVQEPNITLLLNTAVFELEKSDPVTISAVRAFCSQNSTEYILRAPLFCDASGDGIVGFLSGAAFRMGAESVEEFGEKMAPSAEYGELLGHSLYFYSKDTGKPVKFIPPSFALTDITRIPRYRNFNAQDQGCKLWWVEYGGRLDTVHDTEKIKWELWKVIYGVWNHIKNSGEFPEAETLTLEWVGTIPGKRESRRFEGDYILRQQDLVEQRQHEDAVAYGGWSIDLHPADGVFSEKPGCNQWHSKGVFHIPYRTLYSRNIENLFLAGRIISVSHVAFGATRVMATSAYVGQAAGMAAAICKRNGLKPGEIIKNGMIGELQTELIRNGQFIPGMVLRDQDDRVQSASITASSELKFAGFPEAEGWKVLDMASAQMFPVEKGEVPAFNVCVNAFKATTIKAELRVSSRAGSFTPDTTLGAVEADVNAGVQTLRLSFDVRVDNACYLFLIFHKNPDVRLGITERRVTGILSVFNLVNKAVSNYGAQSPPDDAGVDAFEFWCPKRRPQGHNFAITMERHQSLFLAQNVRNGIDRPLVSPNAWAADWEDTNPSISLRWDEPQHIGVIDLFFDTDFDHPMESVLMSHPEDVMPFCVRNYRIKDEAGRIVYERRGNYQSRNRIVLEGLVTRAITVEAEHPSHRVPASLFAIRCYQNK